MFYYQNTPDKRPVKSVFGMILLATTALAMVSLTGCELAADPVSTEEHVIIPEVKVFTVQDEEVPIIRELPGRTLAYNVAEVRPQVNGIILKRKFDEGSHVEEGQELYEIDSAVYQANFDKATAHLNNLEKTMERAKELQSSRAMSIQEYEDAHYGWEQAKADVELARLNLSYCKVTAPLSGKIGFSNITVGALVTNGQPQSLAVIEQIDPIYVNLNPSVPHLLGNQQSEEQDHTKALPFWQEAKVRLILEDGSEYVHTGVIKVLDNHVQEDTGTITLRAEFANPEGTLLPGMFVRALVEEGVRHNGHLIPQQAIGRDMKGAPYVWVINQENKAEMRKIETERTLGNLQLIDSGLNASDQVVVEGLQFVSQDATVHPIAETDLDLKKSFE